MEQAELHAVGVESYVAAITRVPGFRERPGQRQMAGMVARALAHADVGVEPPAGTARRAIAVIQAGTGVGKSAAYLAPAVAIAKAQKRRVVVSTSTTALQEQLMAKDLPTLAAALPGGFSFAVAKGRWRYVCELKLNARACGEPRDASLAMEDDDQVAVRISEARVNFYKFLAADLRSGWDGDRDTLAEVPPADSWAEIAADRHTCTARACPHFDTCSYFAARRRLATVDLIVANHDLVLASIGSRTLPDLSGAYWIFDEAGHLPDKAIEQFASTLDLSALRWLDRLPRALVAVAKELGVPFDPTLARSASELHATLTDVNRIVLDSVGASPAEGQKGCPISDEMIAEALVEPLRLVENHARQLAAFTAALGDELRTRMKEAPEQNATWSILYSRIGSFAPRLLQAQAAAEMLLLDGDEARTTAKWYSAAVRPNGFLAVSLHACPVLPGDLLRFHLWPKVRCAVLTSASLKCCGSWDYALGELGLRDDAAVSVKEVESPYDYARQGRLIVQKTHSPPTRLEAYNAEVSARLALEVKALQKGGLALFTSRRHLEQAYAALPPELQERVLRQGAMSKAHLLAEHRRRIGAGEPSMIFGLASFGEGVDLA